MYVGSSSGKLRWEGPGGLVGSKYGELVEFLCNESEFRGILVGVAGILGGKSGVLEDMEETLVGVGGILVGVCGTLVGVLHELLSSEYFLGLC